MKTTNNIELFKYTNEEIKKYNMVKDMHKYSKHLCKIIFSNIKCKRCGQCCSKMSENRNYSVALFPPEVKHFKLNNCVITEDERILGLKNPCPFLEKNICKTNNYKPYLCLTYPFEFFYTNNPFVFSIYLCPLGKNIIMEILKFLKNYKNINEKQRNNMIDGINTALLEVKNKPNGRINITTEDIHWFEDFCKTLN